MIKIEVTEEQAILIKKMQEKGFVDVLGYEDRIMINSEGIIYSKVSNKFLKKHFFGKYEVLILTLSNPRRSVSLYINRLLMENFKWTKGCKKLNIRRIDNTKEDYNLYNLEWYKKSQCGVGYIGKGEYSYSTHKNIYMLWESIIKRCYSEKIHKKSPTYKDVTVCEEWHNFQNFAAWFEENYNAETMKGWHLDKDILVKGNKIYSPETCCFVPREINYIFTKNNIRRGNHPIGVREKKDRNKKYDSTVSMYGKNKYIGAFYTPEEAFQAYKEGKEKYIKEVADKWRGRIDERVYKVMYNYKIEIDD